MSLHKLEVGEVMGCTDSDKHDGYSYYELSRAYDILYLADKQKLDYKAIFKTFPESLKLALNWSRWEYKEV